MTPALHRPRDGATLVEVMVATVLLAVLALGTAASLQHARTTSTLQRDRRQALDQANSRLESVRAASYAAVKPAASNSTLNYLAFTSGAWRVQASDPGETVLIAGRGRPMRTTVQYMDADGGSTSYDCLRVAVQVQYSAQANHVVALETVKAP